MDCDLAVIGGGSAGYAGARTAAALGLRTVLVEAAEQLGGLCILRGCMPSKTLIHSANRMVAVRTAGEFGVLAAPPRADLPAIIARKRALIDDFAAYRRGQLEDGRFALVRGRARFLGPHEIEVSLRGGGSQQFSARAVLLATGSKRAAVAIPGLAETGALTSDEVLDAERLPASVIVLGAGPVALEMAHYMDALGVNVAIVQRSPHFLTGVDPDVADVVEEAFRERGIEVATGTRLRAVSRRGNLKLVRFEQNGSELTREAGEIFDGLGRKPCLDGLDLHAAGLALDAGMLATAATQATRVPHIFAAGDCAGPHEIVHIAIQQGEIAARNAARLLAGGRDFENMDYRLKLFAVFTEPQVATVGLGEEEARAAGRDVLAATHPFADHGKSMVLGERRGFVKLIADRTTREILGGAVVGPHASDLIHEVAVAMAFRATAGQFAAVPHYHPTLSEIWSYPAEELA